MIEYHMRVLLITALALALSGIRVTPALADGSSVAMSVSAGYDNYYSPSPAWVPVRVTLRNHEAQTIDGLVTVQGSSDTPRAGLYSLRVLLPGGSDKQVTLYIPGSDIDGTIQVAFASNNQMLASQAVFPNPFSDTEFVVGTLSGDPVATYWLHDVHPRLSPVRLFSFTADSLDTAADALATFDVIVLTNVDTAGLDRDQLHALEQYVRSGGSLLLVGGATWQSTLASLPTPLIPGVISGVRTLTDLRGLQSLEHGVPPRHLTSVSVLTAPHGVVLAQQDHVPLVVRSGLGDGQIEYLAFDPADAPIAGWRNRSALLTALATGAAPLTIRKAALQPIDRATSFLSPGPAQIDMSIELSNLSVPPWQEIPFLPILGAIALFVVVGVYLTLRRVRRPRLTWLAVPLVIALCAEAALQSNRALAERSTVVNTISTVYLDGNGPSYAADRYVGLRVPTSGDYRLTYPSPALAQDLLWTRGLSLATGLPPAGRFEEGAHTVATLPKVQGWSTRSVSLLTNISLPGKLQTQLVLDRQGIIVGTVRNMTGLHLERPVLIAGHSFERLPALAAGATAHVRLQPRSDVRDHDYPDMLERIYGYEIPDYTALLSRSPGAPGPPTGIPVENTLDQRIRNAIAALPETQTISSVGEVTLVAWSEQSIDAPQVQGTNAAHRDLSLLVQPVPVGLSAGPFQLPTGVYGARALDVVPEPPQYPCCGPTIQPISIGPGGSAIFAFELPAPANIHFGALSLDVYAGGADASASGYSGLPAGAGSAYDWHAHRWVPLRFKLGRSHLSRPDRFISYTGALMIRLQSSMRSGDLNILDPHQDLQISGTGIAGRGGAPHVG